MKFYFLFLFILITVFINVDGKNTFTFEENTNNNSNSKLCVNTCSTCQNSLYYLKIHNKIDCRFTQCPENCLLLTNEFFSNRNDHINFYKTNQISACDACFRLNMCHMSECEQQNTIIHQAISNSLKQVPTFHIVQNQPEIFSSINKDSDDFILNMELILKNIDKLVAELHNYKKLLDFSEMLRGLYVKLYEKVEGERWAESVNSNSNDLTFVYLKQIDKYKQLSSVFRNELVKKKLQSGNVGVDMFNSMVIAGDNQVLQQYLNLEQNVQDLMDDLTRFGGKVKNEIMMNINVITRIKQKMLRETNRDSEIDIDMDNENTDRPNKMAINTQNLTKLREEDENLKTVKKLSKHKGNIINRILVKEPTISQDSSRHKLKIFTNEENKQIINDHKVINVQNVNNTHINQHINLTNANNNLLSDLTRNLIKPEHSEENKPEQEALSDLDSLNDKRQKLIEKTSVNTNLRGVHEKPKGVKEAIDEEINKEKKDDSIEHLFHKTFKAMKHLKKKIKLIGKEKEKSDVHLMKEKVKDYDKKIKEIEDSDFQNLTKRESLLHNNNNNNRTYELDHLDRLLDHDKNITHSHTNNTTNNNHTSSSHENPIKKLADTRHYNGWSLMAKGLIKPPKIEPNNKTNNNKIDKPSTVAKNPKAKPKEKPDDVNTDNRMSVFSMMFLEKSLKNLDDDFYFITQNLYPDLISP